MKLAPLVRTEFDLQRREELDNVLNKQSELPPNIFPLNLKCGRKTGPTWPLTRQNEMDNEVEVIGTTITNPHHSCVIERVFFFTLI